MRIVLDASVAVKWLLPEVESSAARSVLAAWNSGQAEVVAPAMMLAEVANVLWKKTERHEIERGHAARLLKEFSLLNVPLVAVEELVLPALELAVRYRHPVYDCIYAALAVRESSQLVTADEKLFRTFSQPPLIIAQRLRDWRA